MKRILVPTDFSSQAENALKVAVKIATKHNSEIYLLHSLDMPTQIRGVQNNASMPESLYFIKLAEKSFEVLLKKDYLGPIEIHEAIGHDEIYSDINRTVKEKDIDLIVMGSHGANGFKELFIGSNTEKVVRTANIPVLVIKNEHTDFNIKDFVFATDFGEESRWSFTQAQKFAKAMDAQMHLLFVNTPAGFKTTEQANSLMQDFIKDSKQENHTINIHNAFSVEDGILQFAKMKGAKLIGTSTHGRRGLSHFFNGSISEDLVNHANMPVITFRIQ